MASSFFHVATRTHPETGFWGPVDANHQFCEPHYATSFYFAEFYNSISSFVFIAMGLYLWTKLYDAWIRAACVWLVIIGVGSFLFHGTMRYSMQLLDEGPMVGFLGTCVLLKIDHHPWFKASVTFWRVLIFLQVLALLLVYVWFDRYELFVHGFTGLVVMDATIAYTMKLGPPSAIRQGRWLRNGSLISILIGKLIWEIENRLCHKSPQVWPLHVVWHILSCLSVYYGLLFNSLTRNGSLEFHWAPFLPERLTFKVKD